MAAADPPDRPGPIASPPAWAPSIDAGGPGTPYNGGEDPPQTPPLYAPGPVRPIMGGKPPQTPQNTIPSRMAIFDTSVPSLRSGTDENATRKCENLKNLQRDPNLLCIYSENLISSIPKIFCQNLVW